MPCAEISCYPAFSLRPPRSLRTRQHLPHESILRKTLDVVLQFNLCLNVIFGLNQLKDQNFSQRLIEWIKLARLLQHSDCFAVAIQFDQRFGEIGVQERVSGT